MFSEVLHEEEPCPTSAACPAKPTTSRAQLGNRAAFADVIKIGEAALRTRQDRTLDAAVHTPEQPLSSVQRWSSPTRRSRKQGVARRQLFARHDPTRILVPANIVAVYLHTRPMWKSWECGQTADVNTSMLPFVQDLDPTDPLPDDPRLALPMTVAGFKIFRALCVARGPDMIQDIYEEIGDGVVLVDAVWTDVVRRKLGGEVSASFLQDFTHVKQVAQMLLLRALAGEEGWHLIRPCPLGGGCHKEMPYYVTSRKAHDRWHQSCRTAASRQTKRRGKM